MNEMIIRKARVADIPALLQFEQNLINTERPFDKTLKTDDTRYYDLQEMITASHIELVVAELDNTIIGSGYARIEKAKPYHAHEKYAYLGFMYVDPAYRGKSINKKIIEVLQQWAAQQNIHEMRLEVYEENIAAIKAYEKVGFKRYMITMRFDG